MSIVWGSVDLQAIAGDRGRLVLFHGSMDRATSPESPRSEFAQHQERDTSLLRALSAMVLGPMELLARERLDLMTAQKHLVYHASTVTGLQRLEPRRSTHGILWVYAMREAAHAVAFLGHIDDLHIAKTTHNGKLVLTERHPDALGLYLGLTGSLYSLSDATFESGHTDWECEVVSAVAVSVLHEELIPDAFEALLDWERTQHATLFRYPNRPADVPKDDVDLVEKAAVFASWEGNADDIRRRIRQYHPHLMPEFEALLGSPRIPQLSMKYGIPHERSRSSLP